MAAARPAAAVGANVIADSSGQGRVSRPESFTTQAASQRLNTLVNVENTPAAGGTASTSSSSAAWSVIAWSCSQRRWLWRNAACRLCSSVPRPRTNAATIRVPTTAAHSTKRPTGYQSRPCPPPLVAGRASRVR